MSYAALRCLEGRPVREILLLSAAKMAPRLSMLGLPFGESMRCKLLLGTSANEPLGNRPALAIAPMG